MTAIRTALIIGVTLIVTACGGSDDAGSEIVLVSAAASLTDAFGDIEDAFEDANPGVDVVLNLGGSSSLREQILEGAPADVFASANETTMDEVLKAGEADESRVFARNSLQIAAPAGNPAGIGGLEDLANDDPLIGLCAKGVPCGDLAREVLARADVVPSVDTVEASVRALLTKIELDELDAGITYVTDVASTDGTVTGIDIPDEFNSGASYPITVLSNGPNPEGATAFVEFVLSAEGREIMSGHGFAQP